MLTPLRQLIALAPILLLVACATKPSCEKREAHLEARPGPDIELPAARRQGAWKIPEGDYSQAGTDMRRHADGRCLDEPPPFVPPADAAMQ